MIDEKPAAFRVSWISWDSGFRGGGLRIGDQIIALNGKPVSRPKEERELQRTVQTFVGQYAESQFWTAAGARPGDAVQLTVRRRNKEAGWITADISGPLKTESSHFNKDGQRTLAPDGPEEMASDTFGDSWNSWYESQVRNWSGVLDGAWSNDSFNNRVELAQHARQKERVDFLVEHYPGSFAQTVLADWQQVFECLKSSKFDIPPEALKFRVAEEERVQCATALGQKAWDDFLARNGPQTVPAFPAIHPVRDDPSQLAGKLIVLPPIRPSNWLSQAGKTFFAFGSSSDGWYFADAESPASQAMLLALERYRRLVTPNVDESYTIVARILPAVDLRVVSGVGYYGLQVEIAAALVGGAMFVDVTKRQDTHAAFAGEEIFDMPMHALPPDNASPADVINAFFGALKTGNLKLWTALFAQWGIDYLPDGRPLLNPFAEDVNLQRWEDSQRNMRSKIYDLRVLWVDDVRPITLGTEFKAAPRIDEVEVVIDHVGLFDGEYRIFKDLTVERLWKLQRVDDGPWRISTMQNI
jgi:hypothetical protein